MESPIRRIIIVAISAAPRAAAERSVEQGWGGRADHSLNPTRACGQ